MSWNFANFLAAMNAQQAGSPSAVAAPGSVLAVPTPSTDVKKPGMLSNPDLSAGYKESTPAPASAAPVAPVSPTAAPAAPTIPSFMQQMYAPRGEGESGPTAPTLDELMAAGL